MSKAHNAIAYTRVSTTTQSTDRQVQELSKVSGYNIVKVYKEKESGFRKPAKDRQQLQAVFAQLRADRSIDVLMISEISRLGRKTKEVLDMIEELEKLEISLYIHNLGTTLGSNSGKEQAFTKLIVTIMADLARLESEQLSERIKSGIKARKEKGLTTGRKIGSKESNDKFLAKHPEIIKYLNKGYSVREIQRLCDCSPNTVIKVKAHVN